MLFVKMPILPESIDPYIQCEIKIKSYICMHMYKRCIYIYVCDYMTVKEKEQKDKHQEVNRG